MRPLSDAVAADVVLDDGQRNVDGQLHHGQRAAKELDGHVQRQGVVFF